MAFRQIVNLSNSIVGVSILSMPYCFKTAGILLSILTIIISSFLNRFACYLIISSARISKRKSFENLAFSIFGSTGKLITEIAILGFLLGSCVAFFVVIGDLCPSLIDQIFKISDYTQVTTRTFSMMVVGMFIALPLALKRRVEASFSAISMFLYLLLAMNLFTEAFDKLTFEDNKILNRLNYWNFDNYWTVLPIFCTCLSCQPQLFEIFDQSTLFSEDKNAVKRINETIKKAISFCSILYVFVGLFGYLAFLDTNSIEGNLLVDLPPSLFSMLAKLGFLFTIIFSLPICLFPCRTSLHSLLYGKPTASLLNEMVIADTYIPDDRWILLTVLLIVVTICISIIIPHIEFILGLIGSTTGTFVCFILPSIWFLNLTSRTTNERLFAYIVLYFGIILLIFSTFTLINVDQQELSSQGQLVKNLNLSANRIEKLIDKKDLKTLKDIKSKEELKGNSKNDLKDNSKNDLKDNSKNDLKDKNGSKDNDKNSLKDNDKNGLKDNKLNKSGFINAVEMKKKSKDKLDERLVKDEPIKLTKLSINQNKTELKSDKTSNKLSNNTVFNNSKILNNNDNKLSNHIKLINDKKNIIYNKTNNKDKDFKK